MIDEEITYSDIRDIMDSSDMAKEEKVSKLQQLLSDERQFQRAATESNMTGDDGENARLRHLELALEALDIEKISPEDTKAATL